MCPTPISFPWRDQQEKNLNQKAWLLLAESARKWADQEATSAPQPGSWGIMGSGNARAGAGGWCLGPGEEGRRGLGPVPGRVTAQRQLSLDLGGSDTPGPQSWDSKQASDLRQPARLWGLRFFICETETEW